MIRVSVLLLLIIVGPASWGKVVTLTFKTADTNYEVSYDTANMSEKNIRELILLSPFITNYAGIPVNDFWMGASTVGETMDKVLYAVPLEYCNENDSAYIACGENNITSPHFLSNAELNLQKSKRGFLWLQHLSLPKEFHLVIDYLLNGLAFSIWSEETQLRYYRTWDESLLKKARDGIGPAKLCRESFKKLESARSNLEKYEIVKTDWANCVNKAAKNNSGQYPIDSWNASLKAYGISERYQEKVPD